MGDVIVPGDAAWDTARQAWNLAIDQRPAAVVEPETVADVVAIVELRPRPGLRVAAQGTGHAAAALAERSLYDTSSSRPIACAVSRSTPTAAAPASRPAPGPSPRPRRPSTAWPRWPARRTTSASSATRLGGGLSSLARKHGFAANHVRAVEIVTADGRVASPTRARARPLLGRARRGGNFGIVTAIELELFAVDELYAGMLFFAGERAAEVLHAWREWARTLPATSTSVDRGSCRCRRSPEIPGRPWPVARLLGSSYAGDHAAGRAPGALRGLGPVIDTRRTRSERSFALHMDPRETGARA